MSPRSALNSSNCLEDELQCEREFFHLYSCVSNGWTESTAKEQMLLLKARVRTICLICLHSCVTPAPYISLNVQHGAHYRSFTL